MSRLLFLISFVLVQSLLVFAQDGFDLGRWSSTTFDKGTRTKPLAEFDPYHLRVYTPLACTQQCGEFQEGGMPVFLFVTGFAGQIDAEKYDVILSGVARHGIVVVAADMSLGLTLTTDFTRLGNALRPAIAYIRASGTGGLLADMRDAGFTNSLYLDGSRIFVGGHTSGVHTVLRYVESQGLATDTCTDVGGAIMLSPLDGQDPLGFGGKFLINPRGETLEFNMPGLIISAERDSMDGSVKGFSCVPDNRGNEIFYDAWQGSVTLIDAQAVGTLDVLDGGDTAARYDQFCAKSNTSDASLVEYRTMVRGAIVTFIQGVVLARSSTINKLTNDRDLEYPAVTKSEGSAYTFACNWSPPPQELSYEETIGLILFGVAFGLTFLTGLYCFFTRMDDDTLHRYHPTEGIGYDATTSFKTKLEPEYDMSMKNDRTNSVNV